MKRPAAWTVADSRLLTAGDWLESPALRRFVTRIADRYCLQEADIPDLVQEIRIVLWKAGTSTNVSAAWLLRVISNKAVDLVRRARRTRACDSVLTRTLPAAPADPDLEHLLHARVAELPVRLREFYRLRYVEGWSEREIASRLGLCRASIRWLDHCCRSQIVGERKAVLSAEDRARRRLPSEPADPKAASPRARRARASAAFERRNTGVDRI